MQTKKKRIMPRRLTDEDKKKLGMLFTNIASNRNQEILEMKIINKKESVLTILCKRCNHTFQKLSRDFVRIRQNKTPENQIVDENGEISYFFPNGCAKCLKTFKKNYARTLKGKDHPNWKGGIARYRGDHDSARYNEWRELVMIKDNFKCVLTGEKDPSKLESHHLEAWTHREDLRYEPENGVMLRKDVHAKFHSEYEHPATKEKFEQFCMTNYPDVVLPWHQPEESSRKLRKTKKDIQTRRQRFQAEILDLIQKRGYEYIKGDYINKNSEFTVRCPEHNTVSCLKARKFMVAQYGPLCCAMRSPNVKPPSQKGLVRSPETLAKKKATQKIKYTEKLNQVAISHNHEIVSGEFSSQKSIFEIRCKTHGETFNVSYFNYCRSKKGLPCCR